MTSTPADESISIASSDLPGSGWDDFVARSGESHYLRAGWGLLARDVFGHRPFFIEARAKDSGELVGVLPVVQQKTLLGNFATSMPFFNYGGAVAADPGIRQRLMEHARELASGLGCSYLELRDVRPFELDGWSVRTDKASMVLTLPETVETLRKQLGSKLRSQVKRAEREQVTVRTGGLELVADFYDVFCRNMRDLGTPVYPMRFFRAILERFPAQTLLLVIEHQGRPAAAGFLVFDGDAAEIPWASCRAEAKPLGMNMKLYWELLAACIARGCTSFDFGRSTIDSGTYRFKQQWGAVPRQLHWHRWERSARAGASSQATPEGRLRRYATAVWQRLPMPVANFVGARISPGLPW